MGPPLHKPPQDRQQGGRDRLSSLGSRWRAALACLSLVAVAAVLHCNDPAQTSWFGVCPIYFATGLYCAGCGALRFMHAVSHGQVLQAVAYNALGVVTAPIVAAWAGAQAFYAVTGVRLPAPRATARFGQVLLALLLVFTVARNLPAEPFDHVRPHRLDRGDHVSMHDRMPR
jgi:hypothetical protein